MEAYRWILWRVRWLWQVCLLVTIVMSAVLSIWGVKRPALTSAQMVEIVGGACYQQCINFCGGTGCDSNLCDDEGDEGELCGSESGTGEAWGCMVSPNKSDNCTPTGGNVECEGRACHCDGIGTCWQDDTERRWMGQQACSD